MKTFSGAWPALLTPFDQSDNVSESAINALVDYLLAKGADGFYVCGSTGQGVYMSVDERKATLDAVMAQVAGRVPVIVHVGSMVARDAVILARHAGEVGADGISSIIPPQYPDIESLFHYFSAIGDAAPDLPLLPYILSTSIDIVAFMQKLFEIPNVAGTKYTGPNMYEFNQIVQIGERLRPGSWTAFSGMDEQCLFAAMFGSSGNIGSTLNFMMGIYKAIHAAHQAGDLAGARDLQLRANEVTRTVISFGFVGAMREAMDMLGIPCGDPRLPGLPFPEERRGEFRQAMAAAGFQEIAAMGG